MCKLNHKQNYKPGFELFVRLELHWCQLAPSQELACYGQPKTMDLFSTGFMAHSLFFQIFIFINTFFAEGGDMISFSKIL